MQNTMNRKEMNITSPRTKGELNLSTPEVFQRCVDVRLAVARCARLHQERWWLALAIVDVTTVENLE
jgi:hypothetical protein